MRHWVTDGSGATIGSDRAFSGGQTGTLGLAADPYCFQYPACTISGTFWSGDGIVFPDFLKCWPQELTFTLPSACVCVTDGNDYGNVSYVLDNNREPTGTFAGSPLYGTPNFCTTATNWGGTGCGDNPFTWDQSGALIQWSPFFSCSLYPDETQSYACEVGGTWAFDSGSGLDYICYCDSTNVGIPNYAHTSAGFDLFEFSLTGVITTGPGIGVGPASAQSISWITTYSLINWCGTTSMSYNGQTASYYSSHPATISFVVSDWIGSL